MASFSFNTLQLQQRHFLSISLCDYKYPSSSFHAFNFHSFSYPLHPSPPKHKISQRFVDRRHVRHHFHAKLSTKDYETSTKTGNSKSRKETGSGFSPLVSENEGAERKSLENLLSSGLGGKSERKRYAKDRNARKRDRFVEKGRELGSGNSSLRAKDENMRIELKSSKTVNKLVAKENVEGKSKKDGAGAMGEKRVGKRCKKDKANSHELNLRVELDMCSKRGDVMRAIELYDMRAIELYDKALREGIKMGQYHYAVLLVSLFFCSCGCCSTC